MRGLQASAARHSEPRNHDRPMNSSPSPVSTKSTAAMVAPAVRREAMSYEKIVEYDLDITGVTDYGADMEALFKGQQHADGAVAA